MNSSPKIIVITGAESTGKSTLTESLANYFNVPFIKEFAREYIEKLNRPYNYQDVVFIAEKQVEQLNKLKYSAEPFVFVDTWLIITKIWLEVVFNKTPGWLDKEIRSSKIELFLVCDIDLPWISDPVRENGGEKRQMLQNKYIQNIKKYNFTHKIVSGKNQVRLTNALHYINQIEQK